MNNVIRSNNESATACKKSELLNCDISTKCGLVRMLNFDGKRAVTVMLVTSLCW